MKKKILIVDDDSDFQVLIIKYLSTCDFEVYTADDGLDGIFKASKLNLPDLIIMDINMHELDGIEAYNMIKKNLKLKHIPVLFVSSIVSLTKLSEGINKNKKKINFLPKPIKFEVLIEKINSILKENDE